jgi:hypothetical protein
MRIITFLLLCIPVFSMAQSKYFNFDFEETDSAGKSIIDFKQICYKSFLEIINNDEISVSGSNCFCITTFNKNRREGCTIYTTLPKEFCKGLRHVQVTISSRYQFTSKNGGFWIFATKGNKNLGKATTCSGYFPFPVVVTPFKWQPKNIPVFPYEWYTDKLDFTIAEDPDELMLGFYVRYRSVWFDNIQIILNDKPINDLVFKIQ